MYSQQKICPINQRLVTNFLSDQVSFDFRLEGIFSLLKFIVAICSLEHRCLARQKWLTIAIIGRFQQAGKRHSNSRVSTRDSTRASLVEHTDCTLCAHCSRTLGPAQWNPRKWRLAVVYAKNMCDQHTRFIIEANGRLTWQEPNFVGKFGEAPGRSIPMLQKKGRFFSRSLASAIGPYAQDGALESSDQTRQPGVGKLHNPVWLDVYWPLLRQPLLHPTAPAKRARYNSEPPLDRLTFLNNHFVLTPAMCLKLGLGLGLNFDFSLCYSGLRIGVCFLGASQMCSRSSS